LPAAAENRPALSGTACCLISALAGTAANICMRQLTTLQCNPTWAVFGREAVTTAIVTPWLLYQIVGGRPALPSGRTLTLIVLVGLLIQVVGNICVQWAMGLVGLAVAIPAEYGLMIVGGALLGRVWLGEHVSLRSATAISLLLVALVFLGLGAEGAGRSGGIDVAPAGPGTLVLAVAAAALGGSVYATMNTTIRHSVTRDTSPMALAFLMPLMGAVSLGPISAFRLGVSSLLDTPGEQILMMTGAGVFNVIGFLALIYGLKRTTVVHANVLGASQIAMVATAGMVLFGEPPNAWLLLGVGLTITGTLWVDRPVDGGEV
jgi:drug/metabolite transporter, DME family